MAGLPVVNTQECHEYRELFDIYWAGINCECENPEDISKAPGKLLIDTDLRKQMSKNSLRLGKECFERGNTYSKLVDMISKNSKY